MCVCLANSFLDQNRASENHRRLHFLFSLIPKDFVCLCVTFVVYDTQAFSRLRFPCCAFVVVKTPTTNWNRFESRICFQFTRLDETIFSRVPIPRRLDTAALFLLLDATSATYKSRAVGQQRASSSFPLRRRMTARTRQVKQFELELDLE